MNNIRFIYYPKTIRTNLTRWLEVIPKCWFRYIKDVDIHLMDNEVFNSNKNMMLGITEKYDDERTDGFYLSDMDIKGRKSKIYLRNEIELLYNKKLNFYHELGHLIWRNFLCKHKEVLIGKIRMCLRLEFLIDKGRGEFKNQKEYFEYAIVGVIDRDVMDYKGMKCTSTGKYFGEFFARWFSYQMLMKHRRDFNIFLESFWWRGSC